MNKATIDIEEPDGRRQRFTANIKDLRIEDDTNYDEFIVDSLREPLFSPTQRKYTGHFELIPDVNGVQYNISELPRRKTVHNVTVAVQELSLSEIRGAQADAEAPNHAEISTVDECGLKYVIFSWEE